MTGSLPVRQGGLAPAAIPITMRIAMVGPFGLHPNKTMRARAWRLAAALVARGHQVQVFMPPWQTPAEADRRWEEAGVRLRYVPLGGGPPGIFRALLTETLAFRPAVVHCFKPKAYSGLVAWWLWQRHRDHLRLVVDSDDWEGAGGWNDRAPYAWWQKTLFARQERWGLRHGHALTVASRALQGLAWAQGGSPERVIYLPNGPGIAVPPQAELHEAAARRRAELGLAARPVLLLYSRLFEFDTARLVALLRLVRQACPDLAILGVGVGLYAADGERFRRQLADAGLLEAVIDLGWQLEDELPALLAAADVGLYLMDDNLLNRAKCPVKLADMLSVGLPVVGERVGQVPEYVRHQETGLVFDSGDVAGMAGALSRLLNDSRERRRLGQAARARAENHFSWARLAQRVEVVYEAKSGLPAAESP